MTGFLVALLLAAADAPRIERALERYYAPEYPAVSLRERTEGQVACRLSVDPSGAVIAFDIAEGSDAELSAAVSAAVGKLRFAPGGAVAIPFVFRFALDVGMVVLTGTTDTSHMQADLEVFEFRLDSEEVGRIERLGS